MNNIMPVVLITTFCIVVIVGVAEVVSKRRYDRKQGLHPVEVAPQHMDIDITVVRVPVSPQNDRECVHQDDECWAVKQAETIAFLRWYSDPLQG